LSVSVVANGTGPDSEITKTYEDTQLDDDLIAKLTEVAECYSLEDIRQRNLEKEREADAAHYRDMESKSGRLALECKGVINLLGTNDEEDLAKKKEMVERLLLELRSPARYR